MLVHPQFDPVIISLGPLKVRWYGLMYLLAFAAGWLLGRYRAARTPGWEPAHLDDLVFYAALGIVIGGRMGYVLFYNFEQFLSDPLMLFRLWEGGMAFHGGLLGVLVAMALYAWRVGKSFFEVTDFIAPLIPPGLGFGRIGNFINGELWGRPTELPWGMVFPAVDALPRHPSQLYQALLEGVVLFAVLWLYSAKPRPTMAVSGLFLVGYGLCRVAVEFAREPDAHIGFVALNWLTMGQLLSLPMILLGAGLWFWSQRQPQEV